jgi:hypothetical protein
MYTLFGLWLSQDATGYDLRVQEDVAVSLSFSSSFY